MEVRGKKLPFGGAVLCSNHLSNLDPPVIAAAAPGRELHFFAKKELFKVPFFSALIRRLNAFPVDRGFFDRNAFRKAVGIVNAGGNLLVFPEGTRNRTPGLRLGKIKRAVSYIIYNTDKPVVPVFVKNTNRFAMFRKISVSFGEPIYFPERASKYSREASEIICKKIEEGVIGAAG